MAPEFSWMRRMVCHAELEDEVVPGETLLEVVGKGRVLVEGHWGVMAYGDERIVIKTRYGVAEILGCNLKLTQLDISKLIIAGEISSLQLFRRTAG